MEVLSFITIDKSVLDHFKGFIQSYPKLILGGQDEDTEYYINPKTDRNEIYFHFIPEDVKKQFEYNYTLEDQNKIKSYLGVKDLLIFDIQYKDENELIHLLGSFDFYLRNKCPEINSVVLIHHPFNGIKKLEQFTN